MGWPHMGPKGFFPTNPDLADILGRTDFNVENFYVFDFLDTKLLDFQVSRFPNSQTEAWARPGPDLGRPAHRPRHLRDTSATPLRHLRTTKLVRSEKLGQYRENPISASPVWGIIKMKIGSAQNVVQ